MSAGRTTMIGGGGGLIALGSLALLARYLEMGKVHALALGQPATLYHTFTVGTVLIGLILVIFAPTARRRMTRVTLDPVPDPYAPRRDDHRSPGTAKSQSGGNPNGGTPGQSTQTTRPRPSAASTPVPGSPSTPTSTPKPAAGPVITARAPPAAPAAESSNHPPSDHPNDAVTGHDVPDAPPRDALLSEIDELDRKANEIKVRYGLGKMSPGGYRKFIEELDIRRSRIENLLMEHER